MTTRSQTDPISHQTCRLEATPEFKRWQGVGVRHGHRLQRVLHKHRATLLGAASAATLFLLLAVMLPSHSPSAGQSHLASEVANVARPGSAPPPPQAVGQPVKESKHEAAKQTARAASQPDPLAQQLDALQRQLAQSQAAAASADAAFHAETARLQELLAARKTELVDWRRQAQEAKAAAEQQAVAAEAAREQAAGTKQVPHKRSLMPLA